MSAEAVEEISVEDSIKQAMEEVEEREAAEPEEKPARARNEDGKFAKKEEPAEEPAAKTEPEKQALEKPANEPPKTETPAPQSLSGAIKAKWNTLPPDVQQEWAKREADIHQMMTRHDGELRLGRDLKDVITPYMPIIQAEGGTPATAVQSLLNTAYQLRTGTPQQKTALFQQLAQTYGVDIGQIQQQPPIDPAMQQILDRINGIENKFTQTMSLQEQQEQNRIMTEVQAFAADPNNIYFEQVKAKMAPLLGSGQAKDLQEAYDAACWSDPQIRSTLIAKQQGEAEEKRKAEVAKKKNASASITGSPGVNPPSSTKNKKSIEEELSDVYDDIVSSKI